MTPQNISMINRISEFIKETSKTEKYPFTSYPFINVTRKKNKTLIRLWDFRAYNEENTYSENYTDLKILDDYWTFASGIIEILPGIRKQEVITESTSYTEKETGKVIEAYGEINYGLSKIYKMHEKRIEYFVNFLFNSELTDEELKFLQEEVVLKVYDFKVTHNRKIDLYKQVYWNKDYVYRVMEIQGETDYY